MRSRLVVRRTDFPLGGQRTFSIVSILRPRAIPCAPRLRALSCPVVHAARTRGGRTAPPSVRRDAARHRTLPLGRPSTQPSSAAAGAPSPCPPSVRPHPPATHPQTKQTTPDQPTCEPPADARRPPTPSRPLRRQTMNVSYVAPPCQGASRSTLTQSKRASDRPRPTAPCHLCTILAQSATDLFLWASTRGILARLWCWARRLATGGALPARRRRREPHSGGTHWWNPPSPEAYERPGASRRANRARAGEPRRRRPPHATARPAAAADEIFRSETSPITHSVVYRIHLTSLN